MERAAQLGFKKVEADVDRVEAETKAELKDMDSRMVTQSRLAANEMAATLNGRSLAQAEKLASTRLGAHWGVPARISTVILV